MEYKTRIDQLTSKGEGRIIDIIYELLLIVLSLDSEKQPEAFQYICETIKSAENSEENRIVIKEYFTTDKINKYLPKLKERFMKDMKELVYESSKANITPEVFYKKIWEYITSSRIGRSKYEKALAIFMFINNPYIPYTPVGIGISMDDNTYLDIIKSIDADIIKQTEMIMQIDYDQKTQQASLLIDRLRGLKTYEEQTVYMTMIINMIETNIKEEIKANIDTI